MRIRVTNTREELKKSPLNIAGQKIYGTTATKRVKQKYHTMSSHHLKMVVKVVRMGAPIKPSPIFQHIPSMINQSMKEPIRAKQQATRTICTISKTIENRPLSNNEELQKSVTETPGGGGGQGPQSITPETKTADGG